jgi:serine/threonine protein phosphatase PrpC
MDSNTAVDFTGSELIKESSLCLDQNIKNRPDYMEDFCKIHLDFMGDKNKVLLTLFDGHSGTEVAKECIDKFPDMFISTLKETNNDIPEALTLAFRNIDDDLMNFEDQGATACVVYICIENKKRVMYSANCGDSRAVLIKKDKGVRLSYDHKATDTTEKNRVKKAGGMFFKNRLGGSLAITRSMGDFVFKKDGGFGLISEPHIQKVFIDLDDVFLLMASDGIWDVIDEEKAFSIVNEKKDFNTAQLSRHFLDVSIELGSKDNLSCIAVRLN